MNAKRKAALAGVLFLLLLSAIDTHYRKDGLLGPTVPPFQVAVLNGTAPAPFVYRQGVPQLRALLPFQPGHQAFVVDAAFAAVALLAGFVLADTSGLLFAAVAVFGSYPTLFGVRPTATPEAVAMVAVVLVSAALRRSRWLPVWLFVSIPIRPELPLLFALVLVLSERRWLYMLLVVTAVFYLLAARFLWWPEARWPEGVPLFMLPHNLTNWRGLGGLVVPLALVWSMGKPRAAVPLFVLLWCIVAVSFGRSNELRLFMPVLPLAFLEEDAASVD